MGKRGGKFGRKQTLQLDNVSKQTGFGLGYKPQDKPDDASQDMLGGGKHDGSVGSFGMLAGYGDSDTDEEETSSYVRPSSTKSLAFQKPLAFIKADVLEPLKPSSPTSNGNHAEVDSKKAAGGKGDNFDEADFKLKAFLSEIDAMDPEEEAPSSSGVGEAEPSVSSPHVAEEPKADSDSDVEPEPEAPVEPKTNWQHCLDEGTQHYYYWNMVTNEVTWEIPPDYSQYLLVYNEYELKYGKYEKEHKNWFAKNEKKLKKKGVEKKQVEKKVVEKKIVEKKVEKPTVVEKPVPKPKPKDDEPEISVKIPIVAYPPTPDVDDEMPSSSRSAPVVPNSTPNSKLMSKKEKIRALLGPDLVNESPEKEDDPPVSGVVGPQLPEYGPLPDNPAIGPKLPEEPEAGPVLPKKDAEEDIVGPVLPIIEPDPVETLAKDSMPTSSEEVDSNVDDNFDIDKQLEAPVYYEYTNKKYEAPQESPSAMAVEENVDDEPDFDAMDIDDIDKQLEMALEKKKSELVKRSDEKFKRSGRRKVDCEPEMSLPAKRPRTDDHVAFSEPSVASKKRVDRFDIKSKVTVLAEIADLSSLLTDKLEFLEVTRKGMSKLQILLIEMETRVQDWKEGGLSTDHLLGKLKESEIQLSKYESNAAPPGWTCNWDRAYRRYFYSNDVTGDSQWDYPDEEEDDDDLDGQKMDLSPLPGPSSTPVKNSNLDLPDSSTGHNSSYRSHTSKTPKKQDLTPLVMGPPPPPPPTDSPARKSSSSVGESRKGVGSSLDFAHLAQAPPPPPGEPPPPGVEVDSPIAIHSSQSLPDVAASSQISSHMSSPPHSGVSSSESPDRMDSVAGSSRGGNGEDLVTATSSSVPAMESNAAYISAPAMLMQQDADPHHSNPDVLIKAQPMDYPPGVDTPPGSPSHSGVTAGGSSVSSSAAAVEPSVSSSTVSSSGGASTSAPPVPQQQPQPSVASTPSDSSSSAHNSKSSRDKRKRKEKALVSGNLSMKKKRVPSMVEKWKNVQKEVEHEVSRKSLVPPEDM